MPESPTEKRIRVLSAGPKHKRPTREAEAQERAFKKAERKPKLEGDAKIIAEKCAEIKRLEECVRLVDELKAARNRPYNEAVDRLHRAQAEVESAHEHLKSFETCGLVDVGDLDERQESLRRSIEVIKEDIGHLVIKAEKDVDSSLVDG